jgi:hypothetical protein
MAGLLPLLPGKALHPYHGLHFGWKRQAAKYGYAKDSVLSWEKQESLRWPDTLCPFHPISMK